MLLKTLYLLCKEGLNCKLYKTENFESTVINSNRLNIIGQIYVCLKYNKYATLFCHT